MSMRGSAVRRVAACVALLLSLPAHAVHLCDAKPQCEAGASDPLGLSLSPRRGPTQGGQTLKVEGLRLTAVTAIHVRIRDAKIPCAKIKHIADNMIQCQTGAATHAGEGQVLLTFPCADTPTEQVCRSSRLRYSYEAIQLSSITPDGGPPSGGTRLELRGSSFDLNQVAFSVTVGGLPCSQLKLESVETMTCATTVLKGENAARAGFPQRVQLHIAVDGGETRPVDGDDDAALSPTTSFTYHAPPIVSWVSPAAGPVDGGTSVTLHGSFFSDPTSVTIKGAACAYIKHVAGGAGGAGGGGGGAGAVASVAATGAPADGPPPPPQPPQAPSEELRCMTTRASAGSGAIEVTTRKGGRSWRDASPRFLYALMPELTVVTPALGPIDGGTVLRLEGKRLGEGAAHLLEVRVGGVPCATLTHDSPRRIGCTTPPMYDAAAVHPGIFEVTAHIAHVTGAASSSSSASPPPNEPPTTPLALPSSAVRFSLRQPPRVTALSPQSGPRAGGTRLTISGSGLGTHAADVLNVTVGDNVPCARVHFVSAQQLLCTTPPAASLGALRLGVATASAGRSASHAQLASPAHASPPAGAALFRYVPRRRRAAAELARLQPAGRATATATSSCCGREAAGAIDSDEQSDWRSAAAAQAANLTVDLGVVSWVGGVVLEWGWRYAPAEWRLAFSTDNRSWSYYPPDPEGGGGEACDAPVEVEVVGDTMAEETDEDEAAEAAEATTDTAAEGAAAVEESEVDTEADEGDEGGAATSWPVDAGWVSCGLHVAANCAACPRCGSEWCGAEWCGGECAWVERWVDGKAAAAGGKAAAAAAASVKAGGKAATGEDDEDGEGGEPAGRCAPRASLAAHPRVARRALVSDVCVREQRSLPSPWLPAPWQPSGETGSAEGSAEVAVVEPSGDGAAGATGGSSGCVAARYIRVECLAKRRGLEEEPFVLRRLSVLPLVAMAKQTESLEAEADDGGGINASSSPTAAAAADSRGGSGSGTGGSSSGSGGSKREAAAAAASAAAAKRRERALSLLRDDFDFEAEGVGGLSKELRQLFRRVLSPRLVGPATRDALQLPLVRGVLLHGPPGTGKTLTARKIGVLLGVAPEAVHVVNGPDIISKFLGESEKNMRDLFAPAIAAQKAQKGGSGDGGGGDGGGGGGGGSIGAELHLIIFDEIDAVCRPRGMADQSMALVYDGLVNQLLSLLDGVHALDNILVVGMTNRKDLIDPALLRPGRFEVDIKLSLPDRAAREQILRIHTKQLRARLAPDVSLGRLAESTAAFSGADLAGLVKSAASFALHRLIADDDTAAAAAAAAAASASDAATASEPAEPAAAVAAEPAAEAAASDEASTATDAGAEEAAAPLAAPRPEASAGAGAGSNASGLNASRIELRAADFDAALHEVKSVEGMRLEEIKRYLPPPPGLLRHSDAFAVAHASALRLVAPLAAPRPRAAHGRQHGLIASLLLSGEPGSGRTALAAHLAWHGGGSEAGSGSGSEPGSGSGEGGEGRGRFKYLHFVSPDDLPSGEGARAHALDAVMRDAARAETACVVLDDIERLLGHVSLVPRSAMQRRHHGGRRGGGGGGGDDGNGGGGEGDGGPAGGGPAGGEAEGALQLSPSMLEALLAHLRRPPAAGRQLLVIGVTAVRGMLARTALSDAFDTVLQLPSLAQEAPQSVERLLVLCGAALDGSHELASLAAQVPLAMPLKQILHAVELSRLPATSTAAADGGGGGESTVEEGLVDTPLPHRPLDAVRFAELMRYSHYNTESESAQGTFVHVVNSSAEAAEASERWRARDESIIVDGVL